MAIYTDVLIAIVTNVIVIVVKLTYTDVYYSWILILHSNSTYIITYNCYDLLHYFTSFQYYNYTFLRFYINFQRFFNIFNYFIWSKLSFIYTFGHRLGNRTKRINRMA